MGQLRNPTLKTFGVNCQVAALSLKIAIFWWQGHFYHYKKPEEDESLSPSFN